MRESQRSRIKKRFPRTRAGESVIGLDAETEKELPAMVRKIRRFWREHAHEARRE